MCPGWDPNPDWTASETATVRQVDEQLLKIGRVKVGDLVVIIAGSPPGIPGSTNAFRIHVMGDAINERRPAYQRMQARPRRAEPHNCGVVTSIRAGSRSEPHSCGVIAAVGT